MEGKNIRAPKSCSYMEWFGTWHNQSKSWKHAKANSGSNHQLAQNQLANIFIALLQKGATTVNVYEDGVSIMFKSCFSKTYSFRSTGYSAALKNQFLSRDSFPAATTSPSSAAMTRQK